MPTLSEELRRTQPAAGLREVTSRLAFVSAVMPALDVAGYDPLRWNVLTDLMKVEMERARSTASAIEWVSSSMAAPFRESLEATAVLDAALEAIRPEARLQGVKLEVASTLDGYRLTADRAMLVRGLTGLIQGMLALSRAGSTLQIACSGTAVRPALIVAVTQHDCEVAPDALDRFFDHEFAQHPNGAQGALVLAGVAHVARMHGGRVHARQHERGGCTSTFVVPKPLAEV
jgi:signal transduction histidine kinase